RLRVPADREEALRVERVVATARAFLAISSLIAIYLDATEPTQYARLAYASLLLYALHSLVILIVLRFQHETTPRFSLVLHSVDVLWPVYITLFTEGPNSPFFAFFIFVLLAAAYRWGLRETLLTSVVAIAAMFLETFLLAAGPWTIEPFVQGHFDLNRLIIRSAYLLMIAFLAGYLAEGEKQLRAESSVIARAMGKARVEIGLRGTLQEILDEFLQIFDAPQALLAFEEVNAGDLFLWKAGRDPESGQTTLGLSEVEPEQRKTYFFPSPEDAWHVIRRNPAEQNSSFDLLALNSEGKWLRGGTLALPGSFLERHPFSRTLLVVSFQIREEWLGRLFLLDPALGSARKEELQFARTLMGQVLPAIYNIYLLR
ncbi:MAG: hypothetical protein Q8P12_03575, partial [bacterium]|nr:hypothetical protein [bacterium]